MSLTHSTANTAEAYYVPGRGRTKQTRPFATNVLSTYGWIYSKADCGRSYVRHAASATEDGKGGN